MESDIGGKRAGLHRDRGAVDSGRAIGAGSGLSDLRHQCGGRGGRQCRSRPVRGAGQRRRRTRRVSVGRPQRGDAADQRDLQRPCRRGPRIRDLPLRSLPRRPERRAEISARRPHDRARRRQRQRRRLCRPHHRLARADRTRRQRPGELVLPHLRFSLSPTPRTIPVDGGIVAGARNSARRRRADAAAGYGLQQRRGNQRARCRAAGAGGAAEHDAGKPAVAAVTTRRSRRRPARAGPDGGRRRRALEGSSAYRISVDAELPGGRRSAAEVVVLLLEIGAEPYRVLSWRNGSDGSTTPQRVSSR